MEKKESIATIFQDDIYLFVAKRLSQEAEWLRKIILSYDNDSVKTIGKRNQLDGYRDSQD